MAIKVGWLLFWSTIDYLMPTYVNQKPITRSITRRMVALRLSKAYVARRAGISRAHLIEFLANRKQMGSDHLAKVMQICRLGMKPMRGRLTQERLEDQIKTICGVDRTEEAANIIRIIRGNHSVNPSAESGPGTQDGKPAAEVARTRRLQS